MKLNENNWRKIQLEILEFNLALGQNQKGMNNILFSRYKLFLVLLWVFFFVGFFALFLFFYFFTEK